VFASIDIHSRSHERRAAGDADPIPGSGQDGEDSPPVGPTCDEIGGDVDMDAEMARFLADIEAGREQTYDL
jgi:hypothetical protein